MCREHTGGVWYNRLVADQSLYRDGLKKCRVCEEWKPASDEHFYQKGRKGRVYLDSYCKPCAKALRHQRWLEDREQYDAERQRRAETGLCVDCGEVAGIVGPNGGLPKCDSCRLAGRHRTATWQGKLKDRPEGQQRKNSRQRAYYEENPERFATYRREVVERNPNIHKLGHLRRYGLTPALRDRQIERQQGRCAICRREFDEKLRPVIDHCHATNALRGILCGPCNVALGMFGDDVGRLRSAIRYLQTRAWTVGAEATTA